MINNIVVKAFRKAVLFFRKYFLPGWTIWFSVPGGKLPSKLGDSLWEYMFYARSFEDLERTVFLNLSEDVGVVLDVGANIGLYTVMVAGNKKWHGRIYAIEASPQEFKKLSEVVSKNKFKNVDVVNSAAGSEEGTLLFEESVVGNGALNRVVDTNEPPRPGSHRISIPVMPLDKIVKCGEHEVVGLVKMDVEGHELPVLQGMKKILELGRPAILIEMDSKRASALSSPDRVWDFLEQAGYIFYGDQQNEKIFKRERVKPDVFEGNYFAVHISSVTRFETSVKLGFYEKR